MRHCERKGDLITEIYISNKKNKIYPPTITLSREVKLNGIYLTSSSWLSFWKVILCWRLNIGQFPIGWSLTSDGNYITLGKKEPLLLVQSTCSLYLLPGFFIHDPILLALQLPQTKLGWLQWTNHLIHPIVQYLLCKEWSLVLIDVRQRDTYILCLLT